MTNTGVAERGSTGGARNSVTISLGLTGITYASCANRIEKKLNKVDGVQVTVNYATEKARVQAPKGTTVQDLIVVVEATGYGVRETTVEPREERADVLLPRMQLAFTPVVPVIAVSMVPTLQFPGWQWLVLLLIIIVVFWCGRSFHKAALANVRHGAATMDTLVSLGTSVAWLWSMVAMLFSHAGAIGMAHEFTLTLGHADPIGSVYFEAAAGVVASLLLGRWIEARSKREVGSVVRALPEVGAKEATILRDGAEVAIPAGELSLNDLIVVRPGEKVAADGVVVEGSSAVDVAVIMGESLPVEVGPGSAVVGRSVNTTGRLVVKATAVGPATQVAQIARLVEEAQTGKARAQRLANRITGFFVPTVLVLSMLTFMVQLLVGTGPTFALIVGMAVLIIACPRVLGLAIPSALLVGTGRGAELGVIIRGAQALEEVRPVQAMMLDKTGIPTTGRMSVLEVVPAEGVDETELLAVAAAVEAGSEHPIARAVVERAGDVPAVEWFEALPGIGAWALLNGVPVAMGSRRLLVEQGIEVPGEASREGSEVFVIRDDALLGRIVVGDQLKPGAAEAMTGLRDLGLRPVLLTGDSWVVAREVASQVGIEDVHAEVLPQGRAEVITGLQVDRMRVAMVGDRTNDAMALAISGPGIAMGAGTDAAMAASDLTLMRDDLMGVVDAIRLSHATERAIHGNLLWAFFYNVAAIPVAALGLLTPMIVGTAMAYSSVLVVLNFLRLRNFR